MLSMAKAINAISSHLVLRLMGDSIQGISGFKPHANLRHANLLFLAYAPGQNFFPNYLAG